LAVTRDVIEASNLPAVLVATYCPQVGIAKHIVIICGLTKSLKPMLDRLERYVSK
jgi:hypothetical protein